jgi:two-component system, LytTR family, response regulator LytT
MQVLILEDEPLAVERLQILLGQCKYKIIVCAVLDSVQEAVNWFNEHPAPDLVLMDIELADGKSFELFRQTDIRIPVIFTTAYDQYALDAFKYYSIDYLLKPVTREALCASLDKLEHMMPKPVPALDELVQRLKTPSYKSRFLARAGQRLFFVNEEEVHYFIADNKLVYLTDKDGNKLLVDHTLEKLEALLNPAYFFRLNRKVIARISGIKQVKPYVNGRMKVLFKNHTAEPEDTIISRDRVSHFKEWADSV